MDIKIFFFKMLTNQSTSFGLISKLKQKKTSECLEKKHAFENDFIAKKNDL